jgi:hypothetical protein
MIRSAEGAGQRRDRVPNLRRAQTGHQVVENRFKVIDRIAIAEPGGKGEGSPDLVPIDAQVASVGAKVKHLADGTSGYNADFRLDRLLPLRFMLGAVVYRLAKRDRRNLSTMQPCKRRSGGSAVSYGARVHATAPIARSRGQRLSAVADVRLWLAAQLVGHAVKRRDPTSLAQSRLSGRVCDNPALWLVFSAHFERKVRG